MHRSTQPFFLISAAGSCRLRANQKNREATMTVRDVNWFSSFFGWRREDGPLDLDTMRTKTVARRAASRDGDEPSPRMRKVWRSMLTAHETHPPQDHR
jgi:hypothetical protein